MPKLYQRSDQPSRFGNFIVRQQHPNRRDCHWYVAAPAGWFRLCNGEGFQYDGSPAPEHTPLLAQAYRFSKAAAARQAALLVDAEVVMMD